MTDKNANTEIRKEFCPNCEAETPCTHEAELFVCDICGEDFAKYIVSRNANISDVSVTQDVLISIKTPNSIENTNPDYYKDELYLDEEFRMLAKTYPADVSAIGVTVLIDYVEALEAELARRDADIITLNNRLTDAVTLNGELVEKVESRDEIIARLKEDGERLFSGLKDFDGTRGWKICKFCRAEMEFVDHAPDCPITLHRALMKELEQERRWIPVSERLPEYGEPSLTIYHTKNATSQITIRCLVEDRDDKLRVIWYDIENGLWVNGNNITRWMALPPPPEAE